MPVNLKLDRNGDVMRRVKMERSSSEGNGGLEEDSGRGDYPERQGEPDCIYYLRTGSCGYGSNCRFNHPSNGVGGGGGGGERVGRGGGEAYGGGGKSTGELPERPGQLDCGFYMKTGTCKYGSTCKYNHPKNRQVDSLALNVLGLPMREDAKPCLYYMRTGICKYGQACKYHHPQPTTNGNVLPVPVYGAGGSAVVPSSGAPSAGELSAAALSKGAYVPSSVFQLPQSYMPLIMSPSPGWNYMGNIGPLSMTNMLNSHASNGQLSSYLPERPDQPECRYFMNHGTCKYGSECKYHHPREKVSELALGSVGPLGLPIRPGQPICSYYGLYGICKYGPTCRFDHPVDGYSYAYSLSVPHLAASYSPPTPYQGTTSLVPSSDTSPSKSLNLSDWIKTGATSSDKNKLSNTESVRDDSPDRSDSPPHSPNKDSSEHRQEESD